MSITPTFEELEECTFVGIRVQTKPENISQELAKILPSAMGYVTQKGVQPQHPPATRYYEYSDKSVDMEGGVRIPTKLVKEKGIQEDAKLGIKLTTLPGGKYAKFVHKGPYAQLEKTWKLIEEWEKQNGEFQLDKTPGACFESYVTDPQKEPDQSKLITEIFYKVSKKRGRKEEGESSREAKKTKKEEEDSYYTKSGSVVCHLDFQYSDKERVQKFYKNVFEWTFRDTEMDGYFMWVSQKIPGMLGSGGFYKKNPEEIISKSGVIAYLEVPNVDEYCKKIVENGGKIEREKRVIEKIGEDAIVKDTEGNVFGIFAKK